jgi:hypothetical protein
LSSALVIQQHPLILMKQIADCHGADLVFTYSRYEIAPPGLQAVARRTPPLRVSAPELTSEWLADRLTELGPTEELAWHSWVEWKGIGFHIPMIDWRLCLLRDREVFTRLFSWVDSTTYMARVPRPAPARRPA